MLPARKKGRGEEGASAFAGLWWPKNGRMEESRRVDGCLAGEVVVSGEREEVDTGEIERCGRGGEWPLVLDRWSSGCYAVSYYRAHLSVEGDG